MVLARFVLIVTGLAFAGYGAWCAADPGVVARFTGFGLDAPAGKVESLAMYGGLQIGVGVFLLWAGFRQAWTVPALTVVALTMGGLVLARTLGMSMHGMVGEHPGAAIYEGVTALVAIVALVLLHRRTTVPAAA